ncbi:MAG: hypothetical protein LKG27_00370 [Clostridiaceae bacterium]|jgi:hypothetical protein|nr:hypothetical protein [Clostridiaceae bacterium]
MKQLDVFLNELQVIFKERLLSVTIFGSSANAGLDKVKNNVDLMIVLDTFSGEDIKIAERIIKKWMRAKNPYPIIMGKDEFFNSQDVFAMEYADIQWNYQVVFGSDLVQYLHVDYKDLRLQCEREVKSLLMKLRGYFMQYGNSRSAMNHAFKNLISSCIVIFRTILRLKGITPSVYKGDVINQVTDILGIDKLLFTKLLAHKEGTSRLHLHTLDVDIVEMINQLSMILTKVDKM